MSVISNKTAVAKALIPNAVNTPLDARIVVDAESDFANIEMPYVGMIIYTKSDGKYWTVKTLKEKQIGIMSVANAAIDSYEEFKSGGGVTYTAGAGIKIENNVITCTVSSGPSYSAGTGISIANGVISCTVSAPRYTAGTGISIENGVIACTLSVPSYLAGTGISILNGYISCTLDVPTDYVTEETFYETIGNIDYVLDRINGEEV